MRHLVLGGLAALALAAPFGPGLRPAAAQDLAPVVIVNDDAITRYELDQRMRFMQALRAPEGGPEAAERALVNERLQMEEARRLKITPTEAQIQAGLSEFAGRANLDSATFIAELAGAGVDAQTFRDFVTAGVAWREVLRQRVAPTVSVSDREVAQVRKRAIEQPKVTEVLISELIIPAPQGSEARILALADELSRTVKTEGAFAAAARRYSATPTAGSGGRLPWTPVAQLPQGLEPILLSLQPGQVTRPLTIPGAVVLFMLRDTRGVQRPGANAETVRYLRLTLSSVAEASAIQQQAPTCDMLYVAARGRPVQEMTGAGGEPALASLDPNESVILNRGNAADLVMLCSREPTLLADVGGERPIPGLPRGSIASDPAARAAVAAQTAPEGTPVADGAASVAEVEGEAEGFAPPPTVDQARGVVFDSKVNQAAEALLAELRANAIIRRP